MKRENYTSLSRDFLDNIARGLADYAVSFVKLDKYAQRIDAYLAGSGTLVSVSGTHAILTAEHVAECLPSSGHVGLVLSDWASQGPRLHQTFLQMDYVERVCVANGADESQGPDLALLLLSKHDAGRIGAKKSFLNLERQRKQILRSPPSRIDGIWILVGMSQEFTRDMSPKDPFERVKLFRGICGVGIVTNEYSLNGHDILEFEVQYGDEYEGPRDYGGYSGGGLWQIIIQESANGVLTQRERILSGVAFFQTKWKDKRKIIRCNGRKSIYGAVVDALLARV